MLNLIERLWIILGVAGTAAVGLTVASAIEDRMGPTEVENEPARSEAMEDTTTAARTPTLEGNKISARTPGTGVRIDSARTETVEDTSTTTRRAAMDGTRFPARTGGSEISTALTFTSKVLSFVRARPGELAALDREDIDEEWFDQLAVYAVDVTHGSWVTPELITAISWREARWRPDAVGRAGELGLMQILGREARRGYSKVAVGNSPSLNMWLGVRHLEESMEMCGNVVAALLQYASGRCSGPLDPVKRQKAIASAERVLQWKRELSR